MGQPCHVTRAPEKFRPTHDPPSGSLDSRPGMSIASARRAEAAGLLHERGGRRRPDGPVFAAGRSGIAAGRSGIAGRLA